MVLGESTTSTKSNSPKNFSELRQKCQKATQIACDRKDYNYQISEPFVHHSKKGLIRRKVNHRPISTKQVHKVPIFQNVDHESNSLTPAKIFLDNSTGFERWVLAHSHNPTKKILSRFPVQGSKLAFQGYALRSQHRPANIHKTDSSHSQCDGINRHLVPPLLGRSTNHKLYERRMLTPRKSSNFNSECLRLDHKQKEISGRAGTNIRLARSALQPSKSHCTSHKRKNRVTTKTGNINSNLKILLKKNHHENTRFSQLDRPVRSSDTSTYVQNKGLTKTLQKTTNRRKNSTINGTEVESRQVGILTNDFTTTRQSDSNLHNSNRCLIKRLGISDQPKILQRRLRSHSKILNQHLRITDSMVRPIKNKRKTCCDPSTMRQLHSSGSSQTLYIHSIPPSNDLGNHLETSNNPGLEPINIPYRGALQCSGRSTIQKHYPVNRMVITSQGFSPTYTQGEQESSGRPIRYQFKSPIKNLHLSLPGPDGDRSGYNDSQLGQVETLVSVSPLQYDFEGFTQTSPNEIRNSFTINSRDADTTMVHGLTATENTIDADTDTASTNSVQQIGEGIQTFQTSRLEIIKAAYNKRFPECSVAVNLMAAPLRQNSIKDYQHKWKSFLSFLTQNEIPFKKVTIGNVLQFFTFLFYEKHLKPGTVAHYRTALTVPLKEHFNIDLKVPAVADLLRAMGLQRPNIPVSAPAWSLNKVLSFLENLEDQSGEIMLFRKTAFLLLLATGWRVSELHACVRNKEFCRFTENSTLQIRPHPSFLAKNENSQKRWVHKDIRVLKLANGSISKLCPVTTLKEYLNYSSDKISGDLLLTPGNHQNKLTIHQLSTHICSLILQADPTTKAKVHDVRKYAASCALAETMLVGDLVSAINWSSPAIFYKFYLTQTELLTRPVSLPVQRH